MILRGSFVSSTSGTTVTAAGGSGSTIGGSGRLLLSSNNSAGFSGTVGGGTALGVATGPTAVNPYIGAGATSTPFIADLVDQTTLSVSTGAQAGADAFGVTALGNQTAFANAQTLVSGSDVYYPNSSYVAIVRSGAFGAPAGYNDNYSGPDYLFYINLKSGTLTTPQLHVDAGGLTQLQARGTNGLAPFNGGASNSAPTAIDLNGNRTWATLIPFGAHTVSAQAVNDVGYTMSASSLSISNGEVVYLNSLLAPASVSTGGPYAFNASNVAGMTLNGTAVDPEGGPLALSWSQTVSPPNSLTPTLTLIDSGFTSPLSTGSITLTATDETNLTTVSAPSAITYDNALPTVTGASATTNFITYDVTFAGLFDDADLVANGFVSSFEVMSYEFDLTAPGSAGQVGVGGFIVGGTTPTQTSGVNINQTFSLSQLMSIFGALGTYTVYASVADSTGAFLSVPVTVQVVPEPGSLLIWGGLTTAMGLVAWRRRRRNCA